MYLFVYIYLSAHLTAFLHSLALTFAVLSHLRIYLMHNDCAGVAKQQRFACQAVGIQRIRFNNFVRSETDMYVTYGNAWADDAKHMYRQNRDMYRQTGHKNAHRK